MRYSLSTFLFLLVLYSTLFSCAKRGSPTGGPKDSIPPVLIEAIPAVETINFKETKIKIKFDEYIKLKDVKKKLVISPPQKYDPIIFPAGTASKFISIKILDTLDANTTYAFNFGNSIVDNNEENELGNFKYVFSTGTYIDSLKMAGEVTNPMVKESIKNIDIMLYEYDSMFTDSVIFKEKPRYIANTLDSTLFELTNLRAGKYLLIALQDANFNKIYNPKTDKIGFIKDTISIPTEETYDFTIFKEIPLLKVIRPKEVNNGHIIFGFEGDASDLNIELLTETPEDFNAEIVYEQEKDTINYWYTPFETDSLNFIVSKGEYIDSLTVKTRSSEIDSLKIVKSTTGLLHLTDTFSIVSNTPIVTFDKTMIKIIDKDTLEVDFNTILSKSKTKLYVDFEKKQDHLYNLEMLPNTITDIFGITNDSLSVKLTTKTLEDYGTLNINLVSSKSSALIVELLDSKDIVIRTERVDRPQTVSFNLLPPGAYAVRVTIDENNNGVWDTGSFLDKRQPEKVKFFVILEDLKANWDLDETIELD